MPSDQPRQRFVDIVANVDAVQKYTAGMTLDAFAADQKTIDACERCLSRISEAAVKLGLLAEQLAPTQPWANVRGIGNHLRHDYPKMVLETIWKVIANDLASLRAACLKASEELDCREHPAAKTTRDNGNDDTR